MKNVQVARLLAYVIGMVNQQLLPQNEYLIAEHRVLRSHLPVRVPLTNAQRTTLAEIAKRMGRRALEPVASVAKPETILTWYRKLIVRKFDGSKQRSYPGRPAVCPEIRELIVRIARENSGWGYDRIAGALKNLGHCVSDQTVGNILRRFGIVPAPRRQQQMTWADFICSHMSVLAGIDFFAVEVLTWRGLATHYVLFFLHLETRRVTLAGITQHATEEWMVHMARTVVDDVDGTVLPIRYALHDRDTKFCSSFRTMLQSGGVEPILLPPRSPNLNAFAERWVRSIKHECLSKLILFGEASLRRTVTEFLMHYHFERSHQGKQNLLLFPAPGSPPSRPNRAVAGHARLSGLLKFYQPPHELFDLTGGLNVASSGRPMPHSSYRSPTRMPSLRDIHIHTIPGRVIFPFRES
jgi:putative transposase